MNIEIERKFLVKNPSIIQQAESFDEITQGYFLTEKGISIRKMWSVLSSATEWPSQID